MQIDNSLDSDLSQSDSGLHMAKVGISEAAALVGKSRQTLYRMMSEGKLAFDIEPIPGRTGENKKEDYSRVVDTVELQRVFGPLLPVDSNADSKKLLHETGGSDSDVKVLETELRAAREALRDKEDRLREAKEREDRFWRQVEDAAGSIKLIEHKNAKLQELEADAKQFKVNENALLERTAMLEAERKALLERTAALEAERKELRSELLQEKTKSWWQKLRGQ